MRTYRVEVTRGHPSTRASGECGSPSQDGLWFVPMEGCSLLTHSPEAKGFFLDYKIVGDGSLAAGSRAEC